MNIGIFYQKENDRDPVFSGVQNHFDI